MSNLTLVERLRMDAGMEREDLAKKSGVPIRTIRELESGRIRSPRLATLKPLADALDCKPSELAEDLRSVAA